MRESENSTMSRDGDIGKNTSPTDKPGLQESRQGKYMTQFLFLEKILCVQIYTQDICLILYSKTYFIPWVDSNPQLKHLGILNYKWKIRKDGFKIFFTLRLYQFSKVSTWTFGWV